jgi:uncharacterized protein YidB (DUF937 family)
MGVLDQFGGAVGSVLGQGKGAGVSAVLLQQLIAMLSKPGALADLTGKFQSAGLGNILQSWIGTGQNLPISADQVGKVLGAGTVADLAKKAGIGEKETTGALASLLPQVIDKISPGGKVPGANDLGGALASLGKLLG